MRIETTLVWSRAIGKAAVILTIPLMTACPNQLRDFPDKGATSYKVDQAKNALDEYDFDRAIELIDPVLSRYPNVEQVAYVASSAHAGKAGLRVLDLGVSFIKNISSKSVFEIFAEHFPGADEETTDEIESAVSILETYGARSANRSADLNFYALFLYYSRIGATLNRYAYDSTENTVLSGFRACRNSVDKAAVLTGLPDAAVDIVMTSIPRILDAIAGLSLAGGSFSSLSTLSDALPAGVSLPFDAIPCSVNSLNLYCLATRILVATGRTSGGFGLGTGELVCVPPLP